MTSMGRANRIAYRSAWARASVLGMSSPKIAVTNATASVTMMIAAAPASEPREARSGSRAWAVFAPANAAARKPTKVMASCEHRQEPAGLG